MPVQLSVTVPSLHLHFVTGYWYRVPVPARGCLPWYGHHVGLVSNTPSLPVIPHKSSCLEPLPVHLPTGSPHVGHLIGVGHHLVYTGTVLQSTNACLLLPHVR